MLQSECTLQTDQEVDRAAVEEEEEARRSRKKKKRYDGRDLKVHKGFYCIGERGHAVS